MSIKQFCPDGSSLEKRQSFQTELLELAIDIIHILSQEEENSTHFNSSGSSFLTNSMSLASLGLFRQFSHLNVWLYPSDSKNQRPEGQMGTLMENVVFFSKNLLQKLYGGAFLGDSGSLLSFLADQIVVVRRTQGHIINLQSHFNL